MIWPWLKQNCVYEFANFKHCTLQNVSNGDTITGLIVCSLRKSPERGHWFEGKFRCYGEINSIQKLFDQATYNLFRGLNDLHSYSLQNLSQCVTNWVRFSLILFTLQTVWSHHTVVYREGIWGGSNSAPPPKKKFQRPSKIMPNSTQLWKLLKIAEFRKPKHQDVQKKGSKVLKLPRFAIVLH